MTVVLTGRSLTLEQVVTVARTGERVEAEAEAVERVAAAWRVVERALEAGASVYGVTTGVGVRKRVGLDPLGQRDFNARLIENHRVGQGPVAEEDAVRATMLVLANVFAIGASTVRPDLVRLVVDALNCGLHAEVRVLGSPGLADTAPMADLAHALCRGYELAPGEGLALLNNNAFGTALAALAIADCARLLDALEVASALDLEAFGANLSILDVAVGEARPLPTLVSTVARLRALLDGSDLWSAPPRSLQDPLSFRGTPHVLGAGRRALEIATQELEAELNAAQGNPLVVVDPAEERIVSVANYEILPLAAALDFLRIVLASVLTTANERMVKLLQAPLTGLPEGLAAVAGGTEDGLSEFGGLGQALVAEARLLAQPVSYEVVSSSHAEGLEDRMTMAPLAARRLAEMVELGERLAAIKLVVAAQAVDLRGNRLGAETGRAHREIRSVVPFKTADHPVPADMDGLRSMVRSGALSQIAADPAPPHD